MVIGVAILGAGLIAREDHIPAVEACGDLCLKAIYSRSMKSADALASLSTGSIDVYYDSPSRPNHSLEDLLSREDIKAVIICLPIMVQPDVIKKAIQAGKHVLSEKPIGPDMRTSRGLIAAHGSMPTPTLWGVGENVRFLEAVSHGCRKLKETGGDVVTFSLNFYTSVRDDDKYFQAAWRKDAEYQGGFLLDGGVHFIAAMRSLLGAVGLDVTVHSAKSTSLQEKLGPTDTVFAILKASNGMYGTLSMSFGVICKEDFAVEVVTTKCRVVVRPTEVTTAFPGSTEEQISTEKFVFNSGVGREVFAFADAISTGCLDNRSSPQEALKDLELLENMLQWQAFPI